jgi:hypothetical protein
MLEGYEKIKKIGGGGELKRKRFKENGEWKLLGEGETG